MKQIILSLIKDDIKHLELIKELNSLSFPTDVYIQDLPETIFELIRIKKELNTDEFFEKYMSLIQTDGVLKLEEHDLEKTANLVYDFLKRHC